jgi:histidyl-tRNA synthetase
MKPSTPKGTRDFSPREMLRRNFIFDTIRHVFQRYGYLPIETPAMENIETLMGKYGEEGDRLIFKILPRGEKLEKQLQAEEALRYDLTVPFARYVVQHQNDITFPFKRYQMQPVWRADRPQKGRYREFFQCDADVIGSTSLLNEAELIQMVDEVFAKLDVSVTIKINNRKILSGIAEVIGEKEKIVDITVAIDKLDKIGLDGVNQELLEAIDRQAVEKLQPLITFKGDTAEKLILLKKFLKNSEIGNKGINEVEYIFKTLSHSGSRRPNTELDITLARGLHYYTGAIVEVKANEGSLSSSICGGGRYDDLTGVFGLQNVSGVGISFGIDRIFDVLTEMNKFDQIDYSSNSTQLMFAHFGEAEQYYCLPLLAKVREAGINAELYPDQKKIKSQFDYANKKQIPFVAVVGGDEMQSALLTFKNMSSGDQEKLNIDQIIERLKA